MSPLNSRVKKARLYFYNIVEEYDEKELYNAIKRAKNDFSRLEPYWQNLILKSEALEAQIAVMTNSEKVDFVRKLEQERKKRREAVWKKNLSPEYKSFIEKIKKREK